MNKTKRTQPKGKKLILINGDSIRVMKEMPEGSIDCVITSPPYGEIRDYDGHNTWDFKDIARELHRVVKEGGTVCWNVTDQVIDGSESGDSFRQALYFMSVGFRLHDTMIYKKLNFSNPEKVRYHQMFEYVFILSKGKPSTFNPIKDKKNKAAGHMGSIGTNTVTQKDGSKRVRPKKLITEYGMRGNVWEGKTRGQEEICTKLTHPAMMPKWLAKDLIISYSNEGDTILDPFSGSGTTLEQAKNLNRSAIGIDINPKYIQQQKDFFRINEQLDTNLLQIEVIKEDIK